MSKQWFAAEAIRNREDEAALSVAQYGIEGYVPFDRRYRRIGRRLVETQVPRFGVYIFLHFDRDEDPWPELIHGRSHKEYFKRILSDRNGIPEPVPTRVIAAIRAFVPPPVEAPKPITFQPGESLICTLVPGTTLNAIFLDYRGNTPWVEVWLINRRKAVPVTNAQLERLDVDPDHAAKLASGDSW